MLTVVLRWFGVRWQQVEAVAYDQFEAARLNRLVEERSHETTRWI